MKIKFLPIIALSLMVLSCNNGKTESAEPATIETNETPKVFKNKAHELVFNMVEKVGSYADLLEKHDVVYTYTYEMPNGKKDVITEKYIFEGELSYGAFSEHGRTYPKLEGLIEQGYDGTEYWLKHNGVVLDNSMMLKRVAFSRPTNFYWFTMMQKLLDPSVNYEYVGEDVVEDKKYDVVKISFESEKNIPTDIYQIYINKETLLVDQFLFTVADFGVMDTPNLMRLTYEDVDGILIPTKRLYKKSTWDAYVSEKPWIQVTWSDIQFNNNLKPEYFKKNFNMNTMKPVSLKSQLDAKKANFEVKADAHKKEVYAAGFESVSNSGVLDQAKKVNEQAPNFSLKNATGNTVSLAEYLEKGPVVLTWYRGGWCPYCNLTLSALQAELPNFKAEGANLLALTPELPDKSISTAEKNNLEFEVLSDVGNKVAEEYGIVFKLTEDVATIYNNSFDMNAYNGDDSNQLPLAATYVINQNGKIIYAFVDADYRNRAEPSEITAFLKANK
ncbi:redoxin domain-containing protein [Bizionia sp. KMM 8389]